MVLYRLPKPGEAWRHHKGNLYIVNFLEIDTNTGNVKVSYFNIDQENDPIDERQNFARDLGDFMGSDSEKKVPRFRFERPA